MEPNEKTSSDTGLIKTLSSLQFGIVLLITIAIVSIIGTVVPQGRPPAFYAERYGGVVNSLITIFRFDATYRSPLFIGLLGLFGLNLVLCSLAKFPAVFRRAFRPDTSPSVREIRGMPVTTTVKNASIDDVGSACAKAGFPLRRFGGDRLYGEKGRLGYFGSFTVHLSLLLFLAGGMISLLTGLRGHITLIEGESTDTAQVYEDITFPLGFEIELDRFEVSFYEEFPGRPKSYTSSVTVKLPDGSSYPKDIRVNDPLMLNSYTVYQSSYGLVDESLTASALNDTARIALRLKGAPETMPAIATVDMAVGTTVPVPGFGDSLKVALAELYRNFRASDTAPSSANPAARIDVLVNGDTRWSVYAFRNFPGLNMPMYDDIALSFEMVDLRMSAMESGMPSGETYYTVLGIVRDRGVPLMWAGAAVMMLGLLMSFYVRPKRLWAIVDGNDVVVGGNAKGNAESFGDFVKKTVGRR